MICRQTGIVAAGRLCLSAIGLVSCLVANASETIHQEAVALARAGDTQRAVNMLQLAVSQAPSNVALAADYVVVLGWAGKAKDAWANRWRLESAQTPVHALKAIAQTGRSLGFPADAAVYYERALAVEPGDTALIAQFAMTLAEAQLFSDARGVIARHLNTAHDNADLWFARGYVEELAGYPAEAVLAYRQVLLIAPDHHDALEHLVRNLLGVGAPDAAHNALRHSDGEVSQATAAHIVRDVIAWRVRWGDVRTRDPRDRYKATDRAIAMIENEIAKARALNPGAGSLVRFLEFDLLVALRDRTRMQDVITLYESMVDAGVVPPDYARQAAADAYLYGRQPDRAEGLYRTVIEEQERILPEPHIGLFYSLIEQNRSREALEVVDTLVSMLPEELRGEAKEPAGNWDRADAELHAALGRAFTDRLALAERSLSKLIDVAPENANFRSEMASVQRFRGRPGRSLEEANIGLGIDRKSVGLHLGRANALLDLQRFDEARGVFDELISVYPEHLGVRRLARRFKAHDGAEVEAYANVQTESSNATSTRKGHDIDVRVWSRPIRENYRIFVGGLRHYGEFSDGDHSINAGLAGIEYRRESVSVELGVVVSDPDASDNPGWLAGTAWRPNDSWTVEASVRINSTETPLRAVGLDTGSDQYQLGLTWHPHESRTVSLNIAEDRIEDGNDRRSIGARWSERVVTGPKYHLNTVVEVARGTNSQPGQVYFSPRRDTAALIGIENRWRTWQRYEREFTQLLGIYAGRYRQEGFQTGDMLRLRYEHHWRWRPILELIYGIQYEERPYDGVDESSTSVFGYLNWRPGK